MKQGRRKPPCRKKKYGSKADAQAEIERMVRRFGNVLFKRPYWCGRCKAWHLTSSPPGGPGRVKH